MKNFLRVLIITFFLLLIPFSLADGVESSRLSDIEISLWGFDYKKDTDTNRVSRIEKSIFGKDNPKTALEERMDKINTALGYEVKKDVERVMDELKQIEEAELADMPDVSYPAVDKLEAEFLHQSYPKESINTRIDRLEKTVYGAIQSGDLDSRVERLKASSVYTRMNASKPQKTRLSVEDRAKDFYAQSDSDTIIQIAGLEMSLFGKTFSQDPMGLRLNRLERKIFQRDFSEDSDYLRLQRLQAASLAKKTSKYYDTNKINKYASTGLQLGTFILMILAFIL